MRAPSDPRVRLYDWCMALLDNLSDRSLAFLAAGVFAALGLDLVVIDAVPFLDEALLATVATGLAGKVLKRRRVRRAERLGAKDDDVGYTDPP